MDRDSRGGCYRRSPPARARRGIAPWGAQPRM